MKYRVKKVSYKDGEILYFPQYYKNFFTGWRGIFYNGELCKTLSESYSSHKREAVLDVIDLADKGKGVVTTIEFEHIIK